MKKIIFNKTIKTLGYLNNQAFCALRILKNECQLPQSIVFFACALILGGCASKNDHLVSSATKLSATRTAQKQIGVRYRYGGNQPSQGFDCSGLIYYSYAKEKIVVPRTTQAQYTKFYATKKPTKGDLLFFGTRGIAEHSGFYLGNQKMLHAPSTGKSVEITKVNTPYWQKRFLGARVVTIK